MMNSNSVPNYVLNKGDNNVTFLVKSMEEVYDVSEGKTDQAHRHDYYTIIWSIQSEGLHIIDLNEYSLANNQVFFVHPSQVHQVITSKRPIGFIISFSKDFLINNSIRECFISDINLFKDYGEVPPLVIDSHISDSLKSLVEEMRIFYNSEKDFKYEAIGSLLKLFLIHCNNACNIDNTTNTQLQNAGITILRNFKLMVDEKYNSEHKVNYYAAKLAITNDHLNKTIKALIGKSAKQYIQNRIIIEAKRLLLFSDTTAKEIAFELGFDDPSHFSAFFKKCTNQSVSDYRNSQKNP